MKCHEPRPGGINGPINRKVTNHLEGVGASLQKTQFQSHKKAIKKPKVLSATSLQSIESQQFHKTTKEATQEMEKILGVHYNREMDKIRPVVQSYLKHGRCKKIQLTSASDLSEIVFTKRIVLSLVSQQFDPLGLMSPVMSGMKIFLHQEIKNHPNMAWDQPVSNQDRARELCARLITISEDTEISFPRSLMQTQGAKLKRLAIFVDAATEAMQIVAYAMTQDDSQQLPVRSQLLMAKTRVHSQTIPEAELGALTAGHRLAKIIINAIPQTSLS
jgi:hypothetical protein